MLFDWLLMVAAFNMTMRVTNRHRSKELVLCKRGMSWYCRCCGASKAVDTPGVPKRQTLFTTVQACVDTSRTKPSGKLLARMRCGFEVAQYTSVTSKQTTKLQPYTEKDDVASCTTARLDCERLQAMRCDAQWSWLDSWLIVTDLSDLVKLLCTASVNTRTVISSFEA